MASHAKRSCRLLLTLLLFQALMDSAAPACSINAIYSFGDSIADTGNLLREGPVGFFASIGSYPYGETFRKPTGRCSDGLLIIDYFEDEPAPTGVADSNFIDDNLFYNSADPSPAGNYPGWDEKHAGTEATAGEEGTNYEDQGEIGAMFDAWDG